MKIEPIGANVMVRRLQADEKTSGGILLPDAARKKPSEGRVLSVGDGRLLRGGRRVPSQVSEGDHVLFESYAGTEVTIDGEKIVILSESEILAVVS